MGSSPVSLEVGFRVVATARSFCNTDGPHLAWLRDRGCTLDLRAGEHPYSPDDLRLILADADADGVILGLDRCDASVMAACPSLRVISRYGAGVDAVDLAAATQRGVVVTNTPGTNKIAVAELTLGLLLALARNLPQVAGAAKQGVWKRSTGWEIAGKALGVIGLGEIGREVAARAAVLGMTVLGYDPYLPAGVPGVRRLDLEAVLRQADVITLHCALTPETRGLINAERLAITRPGVSIINTARGGLVDEAALYAALQSGHVAGAAADVFQDDPPTGNPLLALDTFIATPHIAATTRESVQRMAMLAAENLIAVLTGAACPHIVNPDALKHAR
jgi:D-3-phosphoglycerate dehydrogenase